MIVSKLFMLLMYVRLCSSFLQDTYTKMADQNDGAIFIITKEEEKSILNFCGFDEKRMKEDVETIMQWCSMEAHLQSAVPHLAKTRFVERQLLLSKGSIEDCKKRIDRLLRFRTTMPEVCQNRMLSEFVKVSKFVKFAQLPKLSPNEFVRVNMIQFEEVDSYEEFDVLQYIRFIFLMMEHRYCDDISYSERFIMSFKNVKIGLITRLNPVVLKKGERIIVEGHGTKLKGIHLVNAPYFVDKIIFLFKQILKPKLAERIYVHPTFEDLHKHVPKEIIPADFGGDERPLRELFDRWLAVMQTEEAKEKVKDLDNIVSDESLRLDSKYDEENLSGNFRKLNVD